MKVRLLFAGAVALAAITAPALAHHSVYGAFDQSKPMVIKGVITKIDWINPHIIFTVVEDKASGPAKTWRLESVPPSFMRRAGVTKEAMMGDGKPAEIRLLPPRKEGVQDFGFLLTVKTASGQFISLAPDR
jgi:hypothetical protein